ncbi:reverse transcriptase/maturase family protein [Patescibacteria group bacterium]|nr:reverse transcriptase/maturase family protein [Patescibacteria group bacterium]MBU4453237.1 reverse transcriptase/maturase family protein [Patescibacteria group bacterium]MCG2687197.1 reverse transcriptase/maturase family protein [Candidatus Parcubacteria bacterium]
MVHKFNGSYEEIISLDNLLLAWHEFVRGKRSRVDVQAYEFQLMDNLIALHESLAMMKYLHGPYTAFTITDPKVRKIHKATVADRIVHRALHRKIYPYFDKRFITDSYSCRIGKGTHRALNRFTQLVRKESCNHRKTCWVLKCDIRKFFASVDHDILLDILREVIADERVFWLCERVISGFSSGAPRVGIPLGNLTSQLFANVYMNKFDQFIKHELHIRHYIRYADDFVVISRDRDYLERILIRIDEFLTHELQLQLHPNKVEIKTIAQGVDFLGWVHFPYHRVLRTATKRRMMRRLQENPSLCTLASCNGLLKHGNTYNLLYFIDFYTHLC